MNILIFRQYLAGSLKCLARLLSKQGRAVCHSDRYVVRLPLWQENHHYDDAAGWIMRESYPLYPSLPAGSGVIEQIVSSMMQHQEMYPVISAPVEQGEQQYARI